MPALPPLIESHPHADAALARASVLYSDLDGTLLGPGATLLVDASGRPWAGAADAVTSLNAAGLTCVACSGRNRWQLLEISRLLGWDSYIAELGCVIIPGRGEPPIYYTGSWGPDVLREGETPYQAISRVGALDLLFRHFPGRLEEHHPWHLNREATHVLRGNVSLAEAQALLDTLPITVRIVDNGIVHPPRHTLRGVHEIHAYHLIPDGVRKHDAVIRDLDRRGLTLDDALSIGDSAVDAEMADAVALGVLVANAAEDEHAMQAAAARDNVALTHSPRGEGWAEFAAAWLGAKASEAEAR